MRVIRSVGVETGNPFGEFWTVGADEDGVNVGILYDDPDYNEDFILSPDVAEKIGRELIDAANKARTRPMVTLMSTGEEVQI